MKSCYDCFNFIAKIPLVKRSGSLCSSANSKCQVVKKKLDYEKATAQCRLGLMMPTEKSLKHVLITGRRLKCYAKAESCANYDGGQDDI
jgi:hypothetical protein